MKVTIHFYVTKEVLFSFNPCNIIGIPNYPTIRKAQAFEQELERAGQNLPLKGERWFQYYAGTNSILVVAAHATVHRRNNIRKIADSGTGSLGMLLHRIGKASLLITTRQAPKDPNWSDDNDFKKRLAEIIDQLKPSLVIDLHAVHEERPFAVDFGTMYGHSLLGEEHWSRSLENLLRRAAITPITQNRFSASKQQTITKWVSKRGVPAIQLELNAQMLLKPKVIPKKFESLLRAMVIFMTIYGKQRRR